MNTFTIAIFTCIISSLFVLMVAYAMSCMRFKARKPLMNLAIIMNLFPGFLSMIAVYFIMKNLNLTNSMTGMVIVYSAGSGLGYLIAKGFFDTILKSLREAAYLEGANEFTVFWKIILPNAKPVIATTAINAFINPIVDYIFVSVIMKDNYNNFTVAKGLYTMVDKTNIYEYYTVFCAGAVIVAIPVVLLFLRVQKYYVAGVVGGSVKG